MASVTGRLGDAPGVALIAGDEAGVAEALTIAAPALAPAIIVAAREPDRAPAKAVAIAGADSAAHWVAHAAQAAVGEPPGCVWLVVPPEVAARAALPLATAARPAAEPIDAAHIEALARAVSEAARPMLIAGRGCRVPGAAPWVRALAEALPAPALVTPAARGALPDPHPLCHGLLKRGAGIIGRADVVLALGVDDVELETAGVMFRVPVLRVGRVAAVLEELAPRLRDRARADWDVAELDRLRRALPPSPAPPALATLVTRLREATPAGTAAVFARAAAAAAPLWQAVQPGDVSVEDDVLAASAAVALERPDGLVLTFGDVTPEAMPAFAAAGVRALAPPPASLGPVLETMLAAAGPRVIVVACV
jgi:hypothetical protein